jgi:hypothetical protein
VALTFTAGTPVESTGSVTSSTVTLPAGVGAGDYTIIIVALNASSGSISTPSGWTNILASTATVNGSTAGKFAVFYRKWQSGDGSVAVTTTSGRVGAVAIRVQGADQTTFVDTTSSVSQLASSITVHTAPTLTPTTTNFMCIFGGRNATNGVFMTPWGSLQSGLTKIAETSGKSTSQTNAGILLTYESVTANSATGTRTASSPATATGSLAFSFSLKEAAGSTPGDVTAVVATATANEGTPVITGQANIVHVKASGTALDVVPVVTAASTVTAVRAQASSLAPAPVVVAAVVANVAAVVATATSQEGVPVVTGQVAVTAVAATATANDLAPVVTVPASVTAVRAQGSSLAAAPVATGGSGVTAVRAQASSTALAPALTAVAVVAAVRAQGSALAVAPAVVALQAATITPPVMLATASGREPYVSGGGPANIGAVTATATADLLGPVVSISATVSAVKSGATSGAIAPVASGAVVLQSVSSVATAEAVAPTLEALAFIEAVGMAASTIHHAPTISLEAFIGAVLATATAEMLAPHTGGNSELYLKDGTRLLAYVLSGGILIPVDPQF